MKRQGHQIRVRVPLLGDGDDDLCLNGYLFNAQVAYYTRMLNMLQFFYFFIGCFAPLKILIG